ncbi:MAG: hypothetical protein HGA33_04330 [Candidatus Moranbacteria bacterium]|nr:hypothetical protein [Candidatus Moranbacteria bacterium]
MKNTIFSKYSEFCVFVHQLAEADNVARIFFETDLEEALKKVLASGTISAQPLNDMERECFENAIRIGVIEGPIMRAVCVLYSAVRFSDDENKAQCLAAILDAYIEEAYADFCTDVDSPAILSNFEVVVNDGEKTSVAVTEYVDDSHRLMCMRAAFMHQHIEAFMEYHRILAERDFEYVRDTIPSGYEDVGEISDEEKALVTLILRANTDTVMVADARKWLYQSLHVRHVGAGMHARIIGGRVYAKRGFVLG